MTINHKSRQSYSDSHTAMKTTIKGRIHDAGGMYPLSPPPHLLPLCLTFISRHSHQTWVYYNCNCNYLPIQTVTVIGEIVCSVKNLKYCNCNYWQTRFEQLSSSNATNTSKMHIHDCVTDIRHLEPEAKIIS